MNVAADPSQCVGKHIVNSLAIMCKIYVIVLHSFVRCLSD